MSADKKRGLGRGLGALLPSASVVDRSPPPPPVAPPLTPAQRKYFTVGIEDLYPSPEQPRRIFDDAKLAELAESLRVHGLITPLVVRPRKQGGYFLIAGERRWRAAQRAALHELPVVVQDVNENVAFERALVENLQRADLGPLEEAAAYQRLVDELGYTQDQIAEKIGKDRSTIANVMRLLKLPAHTRQLVEDNALSMGHARALLGLASEADQRRTARDVIARSLSVRETESLVKKIAEGGTPPQVAAPAPVDVHTRAAEDRLRLALGTRVRIVRRGGRGRIEIDFGSEAELIRIYEQLTDT